MESIKVAHALLLIGISHVAGIQMCSRNQIYYIIRIRIHFQLLSSLSLFGSILAREPVCEEIWGYYWTNMGKGSISNVCYGHGIWEYQYCVFINSTLDYKDLMNIYDALVI